MVVASDLMRVGLNGPWACLGQQAASAARREANSPGVYAGVGSCTGLPEALSRAFSNNGFSPMPLFSVAKTWVPLAWIPQIHCAYRSSYLGLQTLLPVPSGTTLMASKVFSEIYLHLSRHTKSHCTILRGSVEGQVHGFLRGRIAATRGAFLHEIGGLEDHVHLALRIAPTLGISDWVGKLKGSSTHDLNQRLRRGIPFAWQEGFGVVSFSRRDLPFVVDYIRRQEERHRRGRTIDRLERFWSVGSRSRAG